MEEGFWFNPQFCERSACSSFKYLTDSTLISVKSMTAMKQILLPSFCLRPAVAKYSFRSASCTRWLLASREAEKKLLLSSCPSQKAFGPEARMSVCSKSYLTMDGFIVHIHVPLLSTLRRTGRKGLAFLSPSVSQGL